MGVRSGGRVAIPALALLLAFGAAGAAGAESRPAEFTVTAHQIGDTDGDGDFEGWEPPERAWDQRPELRLRVGGEACASGGRYDWTANAQPLAATRLGPCRFAATAPAEGELTVELRATVRGDEYSGTQEVDVGDQLIVSIGDSVASGEGNPDRGGMFRSAQWIEPRCHRSMLSGQAQAALSAERADAGSSITLVSLGCSGATVPQGLLGTYEGIQPDGKLEPVQVEVVNQIQSARPIDALIISVGANDVGFSDVVTFCALVKDCAEKPFDPKEPSDERAPASGRTLGEVVNEKLADLERRYAEVNERLSDEIPVERVFIVEYFDPTRAGLNADGSERFCQVGIPGVGEITPEESEWARTNVLVPLNDEVAQAADAHHWTLVEDVDESYRDHGICTKRGQRWIRRPEESVLKQAAPGLSQGAFFSRVSGTLHPNELGHVATAELISAELAAALSEPTAPEQGEDSSGGVPRAVWIGAGAIAVGAVILMVFWRRRTPAG